jgi:uncharacterized protein (DUF1684 family)
MSQLTEFRAAIDDFMGSHPQSPLDSEQRSSFQGLSYFQENQELVLVIDAERLPETEPLIEMETSTGGVQSYRRWARFTFAIDGEETSLTIYSDAKGHEFFMPFKDATNGKETYGAGRYLDNHRPGLQRISETQLPLLHVFSSLQLSPAATRELVESAN